MYYTISIGAPSTANLAPDALGAHQRLSGQAAALAGLSASFATKALAVAETYAGAHAGGSRESWASFVAAAAVLAGHSASVASILQLSARERAAYDFFVQIVRENEDLLVADAFSAA